VYATGNGTNVTISANMFSRNQSNGGVYLSGAGAAVSGNSFSSNYQAITAVGGSVLTATNNTISLVNPARSNPTGIYLDNSGSGSLANNTITTSSGGTAISINAGYRGSLSGNTSTGAGMNAVAIRPSALVQNTSWNQLSMPYWSCDVTVPSGMMLTIAAGIVVKNGCEFNGGVPFPGGGSDVALSIAGQLIANGTQASPIVFTSLWDDTVAGDTNGDGNATSPGPGNWDGIVFQAGSTGSISNAVLKYGAGFQYMGNGGIIAAAKGMIHIASGNSSVSVTNSTITGGALYGIYISGTSTNVTVRGNTVAANSTGVGVAGGAGPHVNSNYIYSNTNYGVINADCPNLGACSITPTVDAKNNWWGSSSGPWLDVPKPLGSGDRVSYHVTVTPYSFSGPANSAPTYTLGPGGTSRNPTRTIAGPVNTATGNYYTSITDLQAPTRGIGFLFARSYNSGDTYSGPLGPGWTHSYNLILFVNADLTVSIKEEDGGVITFAPSGASYAPQTAGVFDSLAKNSDSLEESVG
jgi:hypothetical protein